MVKTSNEEQGTVEHRIVEQTVDVPTPQILEETVEAISAPHERVQQRTVEQQIVDAVEVVKAVKSVPQERISDGIGEQIVDDIVFVDQPGDQARCDTQACGDAEKGPSDSDCLEDSGTPSDSEFDLAESSDEGSAEVAKRPRHWSSRHWGRRQGARDGWSWARNSWAWRW